MTAPIIAALWPACRDLLLRVGRWLVRELVKRGVDLLVRLCRSRLRKLRHRIRVHYRAMQSRTVGSKLWERSMRRTTRYSARSAGLLLAIDWLKEQRARLSETVSRGLLGLADERLPA